MGPIVGAGLAIGINDLVLWRRSLRNLAIAAAVSVAASALYFALSPLTEAQSELLARTRPTLSDVLIAFFFGAAGIIAATRRGEQGNIIPGDGASRRPHSSAARLRSQSHPTNPPRAARD